MARGTFVLRAVDVHVSGLDWEGGFVVTAQGAAGEDRDGPGAGAVGALRFAQHDKG